jgi:hypothetical protein
MRRFIEESDMVEVANLAELGAVEKQRPQLLH